MIFLFVNLFFDKFDIWDYHLRLVGVFQKCVIKKSWIFRRMNFIFEYTSD